MRIWDLDPGFLSDKSLLGEHRELHGLFSIHLNGKKGYARHPETVRWTSSLSGLFMRHEILVNEMQVRGFNHKSPLDSGGIPDEAWSPGLWAGKAACWPDRFIDPPDGQFSLLREKYRDKPQGRIPLPRSPMDLWASHKYSVMARDPERYRAIGPEVAAKNLSFEQLSLALVKILRQRPSQGRLINALDHMWGYVSDKTKLNSKPLSPQNLLDEIRTLAIQEKADYLLKSTSLGELGAWISLPYPNAADQK